MFSFHSGTCTNVTCEFYSICVDDNQAEHTCECPVTCDQMLKDAQFKISSKSKQFFEDYEAGSEDIKLQFKNEKVCATNGIAYESECKMRIEACNLKQNIDVANMGDCGKSFLWYFNSISHVFHGIVSWYLEIVIYFLIALYCKM